MGLAYKEYALDERIVEEISTDVQTYLNGKNMESRSIQRIRLTTEELLLNILHGCGRGTKIRVGYGKQWGRQLLRLRYTTEPFDPTVSGGEAAPDSIMRYLGLTPSWSHKGANNKVFLVLMDRKKRSTLFYIMLALIAAVLAGVIGMKLPADMRQKVSEYFLVPLADSFLGLMKTFAGLMVFFATCSGVTGLGDPGTMGRIGKSVMLRFLVIALAVCVAAFILAQPFLQLHLTAGMQSDDSQLSKISEMVFGILPSNPVEPFSSGNFMQIIVIALFTGIGLIAIGEHGHRARDLAEDLTALTQHIVSFISTLVPIFVFAMVLKQIWNEDIQILLSVWKPLLLIISFIGVLALIFWLASSIRLKCSPIKLMKRVLPPFLVALTTASSLSAMSFGMETCDSGLGVKKSFVSFMYPLGTLFYRPATIVYYMVLVCSLAEIYHVEISLPWILMASFLVILVSAALPPIQGAGILGHTILLLSLGIPEEAIVLATAVELIVDFFDTSFNVMLQVFHLTCEAVRLGQLDYGIFTTVSGK